MTSKHKDSFLILIIKLLLFKNHNIKERKEKQLLIKINKYNYRSNSQQNVRDLKKWIYGIIEK